MARQLLRHQKTLVRSLTYRLPETPVLQGLRASQVGFPGLYTHETLADFWFRQGDELTARLNAEINQRGVTNTPANLAELVAATFNTPELARVSSTAARLHHLQFFMELLRPHEGGKIVRPDAGALLATPSISTRVPNEPTHAALREWIEDSFGSIAEFRTLLLNSAHAIKGDGFAWLVAEASYAESAVRGGAQADLSFSKLAVMNTYNAGIVDDAVRLGQLSKLHQQKLAREESAARRLHDRAEQPSSSSPSPSTTSSASSSSHDDTVLGTVEEAEEALLYLDKRLVPLLAIDASMRAYVPDYGVFGKQAYLENVWACIDWSVVAERAPGRFKPLVVFDQ